MTATNKEGKVVYEYNQNNTLKKATMPDGKSISYEYNDNQNVTQMTDYFGNKTAYAYTGDNYLASVTQDGKTTTYEYSNDGLPKAMVYPNGIKTTYAYDVLGNMTELANSKGSIALSKYTAGYDKSGNRVWEDTYQNTLYTCGKEYAYDSAGRMKTERNYKDEFWNEYTVSHYTYDLNGNIAQKENKHKSMGGSAQTTSTVNYTYNAKNQLMRQETDTKDGSTNVLDYTYDRNGNLISRLETTFSPASDKAPGSQMGTMGMGERTAETKTATYTYDPFNQLTGYRTMSGVNASYSYYAQGKRKSKTVSGVTTQYYCDGMNVINEVKNEELSVNLYGATGYISRKTGDNAPNYFLYNIHTDVSQLANENGTVVKNYDYDAWGTPTKDEGAQIDNPIRYAGEYYDEESDMIYLRARYYQPEVGRFISEDPEKDNSNWYSYCAGNPVMLMDPSGMHDQLITDGNGHTVEVRYDVKVLIAMVEGTFKFENGILYIKALNQSVSINVAEVAASGDGRYLDEHLHYTMKEFFDLLGVDYEMYDVQIEVTPGDVYAQKFHQTVAKAIMNMFAYGVTNVVDLLNTDAAQAVGSFFEVLGLQKFDAILPVGMYTKQHFIINTPNGPAKFEHYILSTNMVGQDKINFRKTVLFNPDMATIGKGGFVRPNV